MSGTEQFPGMGSHCSQRDCRQLDFLPFKCDACSKMFCLEHRTYDSHDCPRATSSSGGTKMTSSAEVILCPACHVALRLTEDRQVPLEQTYDGCLVAAKILSEHRATGGCRGVPVTVPRCPVKGCRGRLTFSNRVKCKLCSGEVCLQHRYPDNHLCIEARRKKLSEEAQVRLAREVLLRSLDKPGQACGTQAAFVSETMLRLSEVK